MIKKYLPTKSKIVIIPLCGLLYFVSLMRDAIAYSIYNFPLCLDRYHIKIGMNICMIHVHIM